LLLIKGKQSKVVFHGDVKLAIVHLVLELGKNVPQRNDFIFQSRIHGPRRQFDDEHQLEANCQQFMKEVCLIFRFFKALYHSAPNQLLIN